MGYRFHPTDDEALSYYLRRKNLGLQEAECVVPEVDICRWEPQELPGKFRESSIVEPKDPEWWFFCEQEPGRTHRRSTNEGYWKKTGRPRDLTSSYSKESSFERDSIELDSPLSASEDSDITDFLNQVLIDQDDHFDGLEMQTDVFPSGVIQDLVRRFEAQCHPLEINSIVALNGHEQAAQELKPIATRAKTMSSSTRKCSNDDPFKVYIQNLLVGVILFRVILYEIFNL
ncbi:hypothetical protein CRG98_048122 [Punica granatum]|uniref:NAC domain-containing protein n=1 Tax=Punica granatum TaxID=22663 RepID=A0A2I0HIF3_PUNGR|nr:hypothetical protein CRG98_048122 [Punica granatum]